MDALERLTGDARVRVRRPGPPDPDGRCVVYWMQRAQRGRDNPALNVAVRAANLLRLPVAAFFAPHPGYPGANRRHFAFLAQGVPSMAADLQRRGVLFVLRPHPDGDLLRFCDEVRPALVVGDENPLRGPEGWRQAAARKLRIPFWTVDADVVVPSSHFPKEEYAARTLRPKLQGLLEAYLTPPGDPKAAVAWPVRRRPASRPARRAESVLAAIAGVRDDPDAGPVRGFTGGTDEGMRRLRGFLRDRLERYPSDRNRPDLDGTSALSPWLHFGQVGPHTIALAVRDAEVPAAAKEAFLEELIVRRELAINFIARNPRYDRLEGCAAWAIKTLDEKRRDPRPWLYDEARLEAASTHDRIWNAAQVEMRTTGRMHGYLRMYWAKKILEWSPDPEAAMAIAVRLNDRYELDGRDPNGYTGIAWAIGGKHDRPWAPRRPVFGLIRWMSPQGMERRFDVDAYVRRVEEASGLTIEGGGGAKR